MNSFLFWMFHIAFWLSISIGNTFENQKVKAVCNYARPVCLGAMFMFVLQIIFKGA